MGTRDVARDAKDAAATTKRTMCRDPAMTTTAVPDVTDAAVMTRSVMTTMKIPEVRVRYGVLVQKGRRMYVRDEDSDELFLAPSCQHIVLDPKLIPRASFTVAPTLKKGEAWADRVYLRP